MSTTSASLVGRRHELEAVRASVAAVAGGTPGTLLLTGLPGVGKTRLAREALALAAASGFATVAGRAHRLGRDLAYAPLVAPLGTMLRSADARRREVLLGDLPQLGPLFSGLGLADPTPLGDPALEQARLVEGLSRLVDRIARERPLAMLIDDVHVADTSTTAFLHYLTESVTDRPVLLVLTARPDDPGSDQLAALAHGLSESSWAYVQLAVPPLTALEAAELIENVLGARADPKLIELVGASCGGRPLFLDAVTRTLVENRQVHEQGGVVSLVTPSVPLPDLVRDQLRIRLAHVSADEKWVLDVLAVADHELDYQVLAAAVTLPGRSGERALDRLRARALVVNGTSPSKHELVHGLLRDALLADLSEPSRAGLHARLAEALLAADPASAQAANHVLEAGRLIAPGLALEHLVRGAEHATSIGASEDAVRFLQAAVDAATRLDDAERLADLRHDLAAVLRRTGNPQVAAEQWRIALAGYRDLGAAAAVSAIEQELGMLDWSSGELDQARAHFAAAEQALEGLEPSPAHAALLFNKVVTASRVGDTGTVARTAPALRELAGRLGQPALVAQAYLAEAVLEYCATDYLAMLDTNLKALAAAEQSDDRALVLRAYDQLSVAAASQLDIPQLRRFSERSLQVAGELGAPLLGGWPRARLAAANLLSGDWDAALRVSTELIVLTGRFDERRGSVSGFAGHAWILTHRGRLADARSYLDQAHAAARPMLESDHNVFSIVAIAGANLALVEDDPQRALAYAGQLDIVTGGWMPLLGLSCLGEALARSGDLDGAIEVADRFSRVRSCSTVAPAALADWVAGHASAQAQDTAAAATRFAAAAVGFERLGLPFLTARARLHGARAIVGQDQDDAAAGARAALAVFERLGAPVEAQAARALLRELGMVPSRGRARRATGSRLSTRELEVARFVASGLTNAEVATALFISPRTVTTHLDRIYDRLQLSSRVALTRYLADSGLLDQSESPS